MSSLMSMHYVGGGRRTSTTSGFITVSPHPSSEGVKKERDQEVWALAH